MNPAERRDQTRRLRVVAALAVVAFATTGIAALGGCSGDSPEAQPPVRPSGASFDKATGSAKPLLVRKLEVGSPDRYVEPEPTPVPSREPTPLPTRRPTPEPTSTPEPCPPNCPG